VIREEFELVAIYVELLRLWQSTLLRMRKAIAISTRQLFIVGVNPLLLQVLATPGAASAMATPVDYQWYVPRFIG
jgi:hypothetical protein